jgi:hypothetical protein
MKENFKRSQTNLDDEDKIEGNTIVLHAVGEFPKDIIIFETDGRKRTYRLQKTKSGRYLLN